MVKPSSSSISISTKSSSNSSDDMKREEDRNSVYRGVRKRKWGKYVSEIRLPNSRQRIWLGSYDTPEKAARAFDAALFCLRGKSAKFNFPNNPPDIEVASDQSLTPLQIQSVAAKFAHDHENSHEQTDISSPEYSSTSISTPASGTAATATDLSVPVHDHDISNDLSMDWAFLDFLSVNSSTVNYESAEFSDFSTGLDDFFPPLPETAPAADYVEDNGCTEAIFPYHHHNQQSFLWNF